MRENYFLILYMIFGLISCTGASSENKNFAGSYKGLFKHNKFEIDIRFDIEEDSLGNKVYFSSLMQNAFRIPTRNININNDSISFVLQSDFYTYLFTNKINVNNNSLEGILEVDSNCYPYKLNKLLQTENNNTEELNFESSGNNLSGTIWKPAQPIGQAIFFVTSSGGSDRSSTNAQAKYFVNKGYFVFHFDKRGTGKSAGNLNNVTIEDLAKDDINAIQLFSKKINIPLKKINIVGSSQGGAKVPLILNSLPKLQSGISVSTPGCSLLESDLNFMMNRLNNQIKEENIQEATNAQRAVFEYLAGKLSKTKMEIELEKHKNKSYYQNLWIPEFTNEIHQGLSYTPIPHFEKTKQPVLIIQGLADIVIPNDSFFKIESALKKSGNNSFKVVKFKNTNHSMTISNSSDFPYWSVLHPNYYSEIENWLLALNR